MVDYLMSNFLGIDFGRTKVGLAYASGSLAAPLKVLRLNASELSVAIKRICEEERITRIVIGVSDGVIADEARTFGESLKKELGIEVDYWDETLTTQDVQKMSIEAGMSRKKRHQMEDAFAATLILQNYLDNLTV